MWPIVKSIKKICMRHSNQQDYFSPYPFFRLPGKISVWTSLEGCLGVNVSTLYWWWWTNSLSMLTSYLWLIPMTPKISQGICEGGTITWVSRFYSIKQGQSFYEPILEGTVSNGCNNSQIQFLLSPRDRRPNEGSKQKSGNLPQVFRGQHAKKME